MEQWISMKSQPQLSEFVQESPIFSENPDNPTKNANPEPKNGLIKKAA